MRKLRLKLLRRTCIGIAFTLFFSLIIYQAKAQTDLLKIEGIIRDEAGEPLVGVTVKGGTTSLATNVNGKFTVQVKKGASLTFTSTGYATKVVVITKEEALLVTLTQSQTALTDVIVVGYGEQKRASVTGAISTIQSADLVRTPATTTSGALTGIQGVNLRSVTGQPGSTTAIQIRNMGAALFVVDGIPQSEGQFNQIGIEDIESISVLKDAAAAIYGVRASNGVVLVTTKKGKAGKNTLNVNSYYGLQNITRYMEPANAYEYQLALAQSEQNIGLTPTITPDELAKWKDGTQKGYQSTNYKDVIIQNNAPRKYLNVSASGATDKINYYLSLSSVKEDALLQDYYFKRHNFQSNIEGTVLGGLKIGAQLSGRLETRHNVASTTTREASYDNPFLAILTMWPTERMYANDNPNYINANINTPSRNPLLYDESVVGTEENLWRNFGSIFHASAKLPFGIKFRAAYSLNYKQNSIEYFRKNVNLYTYAAATDSYTAVPSALAARTKSRDEIKEDFAQIQLNYNTTIKGHSIGAFMGYEYASNLTQGMSVSSVPPTNILQTIEFVDATGINTFYTPSKRVSIIGRFNYDYKSKYLLEVLGRYDGSHLYAPGKRYGLFPGVSAGWRVSEENFIKNKFPSISNLKLRASWGRTGQEQGVETFDYLGGGRYSEGTYVLDPSKVTTGIDLLDPPITNITWVTSTMENIGVDIGFFKNKLTATVDVFRRTLSGIPVERRDLFIPSEIGYTLPSENLNSTRTQGIEGIITYASQSHGVRYSISGNATLARRKILDVYAERFFTNSWEEYRNRTANRWSNIYWGYEAVGQFQSMDEIKNYPINNDNQGNRTQLPGDIKLKDQNGDGIINIQDERPIGYATGASPYLTFGFNTSLSFKGIDILTDWAGAAMQSYYRALETQIPFQANHNSPKYIFNDVWHRADVFDPNSEWVPGKYPAVRRNGGTLRTYTALNTFWMKNVKYLRLKNLQVGYNLPQKMLSKAHISRLRIYVTGTNLFSIDNVKDIEIDPEISLNSALVYPNTKVYTLGINLTL